MLKPTTAACAGRKTIQIQYLMVFKNVLILGQQHGYRCTVLLLSGRGKAAVPVMQNICSNKKETSYCFSVRPDPKPLVHAVRSSEDGRSRAGERAKYAANTPQKLPNFLETRGRMRGATVSPTPLENLTSSLQCRLCCTPASKHFMLPPSNSAGRGL